MLKRKEIKQEIERLEKEIKEIDEKKEPTKDQKNRRNFLVSRKWALRWVLQEGNTTKIRFDRIRNGVLAEVHLVDNTILYGELKTTDREDMFELENEYIGIVTIDTKEVKIIYHDMNENEVRNVRRSS